MNKKGTYLAILVGGAGLVFAWLVYRRFKYMTGEMKKELRKVGRIVIDNNGKIEKHQAALIAGIIMRFSHEKVLMRLKELREERIKIIRNGNKEEEYVEAVLKAANEEHTAYNEVSQEVCKYLNIPSALLVNSSEYYAMTKDEEYTQLVSKYFSESAQHNSKISSSEADKIYKTMAKLTQETLNNHALQNAAETIAFEYKANVSSFVELTSKTYVYDLLYKKYNLSEDEIQLSFKSHNIRSNNYHNS